MLPQDGYLCSRRPLKAIDQFPCMDASFYQQLFEKHQKLEAVPPNEVIASWAHKLIRLMFPEQAKHPFNQAAEIAAEFEALERQLLDILIATKACQDCNNAQVAAHFFSDLPRLYRLMSQDAQALYAGDPAARSEFEVIRTYPGFAALSYYRVAHALWALDVPLLPRILTEFAHSHTGIDIHPAAVIGEHCFIDHGSGIVIGETAVIGNYVKIYQGVTLGALSVDKRLSSQKRHPTVEDHVVIYSGATILGGDTVIGHHSVIGGNVWLTRSVPPGSTVYHKPMIEVVENRPIH